MQFEKSKNWASASGWLISPDIIVTAGHCAYNHDSSHSLGRVTSIKAYIGYHGRQFVHDQSVQFRYGRRIATTADYVNSGKKEATDVAFIQVNKPFTGVKQYQYAETPVQSSEVIGIVGYPADKRYNNQKDGDGCSDVGCLSQGYLEPQQVGRAHAGLQDIDVTR